MKIRRGNEFGRVEGLEEDGYTRKSEGNLVREKKCLGLESKWFSVCVCVLAFSSNPYKRDRLCLIRHLI